MAQTRFMSISQSSHRSWKKVQYKIQVESLVAISEMKGWRGFWHLIGQISWKRSINSPHLPIPLPFRSWTQIWFTVISLSKIWIHWKKILKPRFKGKSQFSKTATPCPAISTLTIREWTNPPPKIPGKDEAKMESEPRKVKKKKKQTRPTKSTLRTKN